VLIVEHVRKDFGRICAVRDVSFTVPDGTTFGLIGPNGAGKTTTMRLILGILAHDAGTIVWNGEPVHGAMRRRFGYLPEERGLYGRMSVREHIAYFARLHGLRDRGVKAATDEWIERLDLGEYRDRPCSELSKGNQQKVQIACAAVHSPELLVLDEAFSGLDPVNAEMLLGVLRQLKALGTTLILSSHQMWQLEQLCTRYCIITGGENRVAGTLADLRANIPTRVIRAAPGSATVCAVLDALEGARRLPPVEDDVVEYEVPATTAFAEVLKRLVSVDTITRFEAVNASLRDIYLDTVEGLG
jgi:ABC-2 type transport system ATP-binding protein